jgi:hypothetical protein
MTSESLAGASIGGQVARDLYEAHRELTYRVGEVPAVQ